MINFPTVFSTVKNMQNFINSNFSNIELQRETEKIFFTICSCSKEFWNSILERENRNTELHQWLTLFKHIQIRYLSKEFLCRLDEKINGSSSYIYDPRYSHELNTDNLLDLIVNCRLFDFSYNKFKFLKEIGVDFYYTPTVHMQLKELASPTKYNSIIEKTIKHAIGNRINEIIRHYQEFFPNLYNDYEQYNEKYEQKFKDHTPQHIKSNLILSVRKTPLLEEFFNHGTDFKTYRDSENKNILYDTCAQNPSLSFVQYLLVNGVDKNLRTNTGYTTKEMIEYVLKNKEFFVISSQKEQTYYEILKLL